MGCALATTPLVAMSFFITSAIIKNYDSIRSFCESPNATYKFYKNKNTMNRIFRTVENRACSILFTRSCLLGIILIFSFFTGCTTFERYDPSPVGTFYPYQPIQGVSFTKDDFWNSENRISFSQPAEIKAVGKMTWNSLTGHYYEVALISPKLDHLPGDYWINTDGDYYATIAWLQTRGRIEYTGSKTSGEYFWESGWGFIVKILILVILVYLGYKIIRYLIKKNEEKRILIERMQREEEERKRMEEELRKEQEIERRKNMVLDIVNNLYKETEREVNKTLIPTLINELYDIYTGLHSDNIDDLVMNGSLKDFQNILNSIISELNRLKKLALDAQLKGFTDDKDYTLSNENDGKMTKEKAFEILGIKPSSTKEEIKKAYRDMVKKYNTDQRTQYEDHIKKMLEDKMKELNSAKDYLSTLGLI